MNERIEKLAEQCGFRSNPDIYDRNQSFDIERFAELIVQECAETVQDFVDHRFPASEYPNRLKRYFGVEE